MRTTAWIAAALALAAVLLASWLTLREPATPARHAPAEELASAQPASDARSAPPPQAAKVADAIERSPLAVALPASAPAPVDADEFVIACVRESDGEPVADARVWAVDERDERWLLHGRDAQAFDASLEDLQPARSDRDGRARIPWPLRSTWLRAQSADLFAEAWLPPLSTSPLRLALSSDASLAVEVVDQRGAPVAGAPVALRARDLEAADLEVRRTDADGIARFPHARAVLERRTAIHARTFVALAIVALEPVEVPLDAAQWPEQPVRIVAPPMGALDVEIVDANGSAISDRRAYSSMLEAFARSRGGEREGEPIQVPIRASRARFDAVALELELVVSFGRSTGNLDPALQVAGPRNPGQRVAARYGPGMGRSSLAVRCIGPDGVPLASMSVRVRRADNSPEEVGYGLSDDAGRARVLKFEFDEWPAVGTPLVFDIRPAEERPGTNSIPRYSARAAMPALSEAGEGQFGDVVAQLEEPEPFLCSGRVLDHRGRGLSGVSVEVEERLPDELSLEQQRARHPASARAESDDRGYFEVFGRVPGETISVRARLLGRSEAGLECARGAHSLELVLTSRSIAGRVLLDAGIDARELRVGGGGGSWAWPPLRDGSFSIPVDGSGRCSLWIALPPPIDTELFSLDDLEVRAGEVTRDPGLDPIDLRGKIFPWRLRFTSSTGAPVRGGNIAVRDLVDPEREWYEHSVGPSGAHLLLPHSAFEAAVHFEGFQWEHLLRAGAEQQVELVPLPALELAIRDGLPPSKLEYSIDATLWPVDWDDGTDERMGSSFEADGKVRVRAARAGRNELRFELRLEQGEHAGSSEPFASELLEVPVGEGERHIELALDRATIAAALAKLGE